MQKKNRHRSCPVPRFHRAPSLPQWIKATRSRPQSIAKIRNMGLFEFNFMRLLDRWPNNPFKIFLCLQAAHSRSPLGRKRLIAPGNINKGTSIQGAGNDQEKQRAHLQGNSGIPPDTSPVKYGSNARRPAQKRNG